MFMAVPLPGAPRGNIMWRVSCGGSQPCDHLQIAIRYPMCLFPFTFSHFYPRVLLPFLLFVSSMFLHTSHQPCSPPCMHPFPKAFVLDVWDWLLDVSHSSICGAWSPAEPCWLCTSELVKGLHLLAALDSGPLRVAHLEGKIKQTLHL